MTTKMDLAKAYDRVDCFPNKCVELIMNCVSQSSLSIVWNGQRLSSFQPKRGLDRDYKKLIVFIF